MRKITINLRDIIFYGRCYPTPQTYGSKARNASVDTPIYSEKWFFIQTKELTLLNDLIQQEVCTNENKNMILPRLGYIRLFEVDIIALENLFVQSLNDRKISSFFGSIPDEKYNGEFNKFIEPFLIHRWNNNKKEVLKKRSNRLVHSKPYCMVG